MCCAIEPILEWSWPHFVILEILSVVLEIAVRSTLSISYAFYSGEVFLRLDMYMFYVTFENSSICVSMWR